MQDDVKRAEREVEIARARLTGNLATLKDPQTFTSFKNELKQEAMETKDHLVNQAKESISTSVSDFVEEWKAKAAANPVAVLAIGAGIGWHMLRKPPITTALVGFGLYSLFNTRAYPYPNADYYGMAKSRLKVQASEYADTAMDAARTAATEASQRIADTSANLYDAAKGKVQDAARVVAGTAEEMATSASDAVARAKQGASETAARLQANASDAVQGLKDQADAFAARASGAASEFAERTGALASRVQQRADDPYAIDDPYRYRTPSTYDQVTRQARDTFDAGRDWVANTAPRDQMMLGLAGLAVAAAVGIAWQKRSNDD